jgi:hypothetical protein
MHIEVKGLGVGVWKELTKGEREALLEAVGRLTSR